jgi:hypothetical protein
MDDKEKQALSYALRSLGLSPRRPLTEREIKLAPYSDELKRIIVRAIDANPAMEETFFTIAELAFMDGEDSVD